MSRFESGSQARPVGGRSTRTDTVLKTVDRVPRRLAMIAAPRNVAGAQYHPAVISKVLLGFGFATLTGWMVYRVLGPVRAIWRGDASRVPTVPRMPPHARTYLLYAMWFTMIFGGLGLAMLAYALRQLLGTVLVLKGIGRTGLDLSFARIALLPVHLFVYCFNRPSFLVTPAWRHEHGPLGAIWRRLRRR
jgi:hypothetical protein